MSVIGGADVPTSGSCASGAARWGTTHGMSQPGGTPYFDRVLHLRGAPGPVIHLFLSLALARRVSTQHNTLHVESITNSVSARTFLARF